ncbi:MAG: hypothetical protein IJ760_05080 [Bacteroidales bacterium]|nr:hypothetical protein [Bacteroidales bacterium]
MKIKLTMVMFVAAATMFVTSCNKGDDNNGDNPSGGGSSAISEANLVGEWGWPSSHTLAGETMVFTKNHIVKYDGKNYTWQISGKHLRGVFSERFIIEFDIVEIDGATMRISGTVKDSIAQMSGVAPTDISGTLVKTRTFVPTSLDESMMIGDWRCDIEEMGTFGLTVNEDHTCSGWHGSLSFDWSIEGTNFKSTGGYTSDNYEVEFSADSITTSAMKTIMYVKGTDKHHKHNVLTGADEDSATEFTGKLTKNI